LKNALAYYIAGIKVGTRSRRIGSWKQAKASRQTGTWSQRSPEAGPRDGGEPGEGQVWREAGVLLGARPILRGRRLASRRAVDGAFVEGPRLHEEVAAEAGVDVMINFLKK
jgi:hypothetical protein